MVPPESECILMNGFDNLYQLFMPAGMGVEGGVPAQRLWVFALFQPETLNAPAEKQQSLSDWALIAYIIADKNIKCNRKSPKNRSFFR